MQYWKDLPKITYQGIDEHSVIELEVDGHVEPVPDDRKTEEIVFLGRMDGTVYLIFGQVCFYEYIQPEKSASGREFTRLRVEGTCVTVF